MKKLLSLLSVLTISGPVVPTVIAASPYQKEQPIREKMQTQNHIFKTNGADKPSQQQIKEKVKQLNPQVNINRINVTNITENSAVITITGFGGQKAISFIVDKSFDLTKIIEKTNLGSIITGGINLPKEQWLKDWLKQQNPQLDITKIKVQNIVINNATIVSSDNNFYSGEVNIIYIISLKSLITNTDLGSIKTNGWNGNLFLDKFYIE